MHISLFALALGVFAHLSSAVPQRKLSQSTHSHAYEAPLVDFLNSESFSTPAPATTGAATTCGSCYGVADVLAVVFGEAVEIVVTQTVATSTGRNGSTVTVTLSETITTSAPETTGAFTFNPSGIVSPGPTAPATIGGSGGTVTIGSLTLFVSKLLCFRVCA